MAAPAPQSARGPRPRSAPAARAGDARHAAFQAASGTPEARHSSVSEASFSAAQRSWALRHSDSKRRLQEMKRQTEERALQQCTFRPTIGSRSQLFATRARGCSFEPLTDRLHHEADKRVTLREKAKQLLDADEMCEHTFHPQINRSFSSTESGRAPIHLRARTIQQLKQERVRAVQMGEAMREGALFQPRISQGSQRMVEKRRTQLSRSLSEGQARPTEGPVEQRLYTDARMRQVRQQEGQGAQPQAPALDGGSRRICESSVYFQGSHRDFLARQRTFELARQRRMEVRARHAEEKCSFRPKITEASRQILVNNIDFVQSTAEDTTRRLAVKDVGRRGEHQRLLEQLHYKECTFRPEVNPATHLLGPGAEDPVYERLYKTPEAKPRRSAEPNEERGTAPKQPPERPPTPKQPLSARSSKRFSHVKPHYAGQGASLMERIQDEVERREERRQERRSELEEHEFATCTFAPETTTYQVYYSILSLSITAD